jgi:hypothetical protein
MILEKKYVLDSLDTPTFFLSMFTLRIKVTVLFQNETLEVKLLKISNLHTNIVTERILEAPWSPSPILGMFHQIVIAYL